ncbi:mitochondrial CIV assembly protein Cmc2 [Andalucia godoyi]|uniref:COX assembly mitochondrial protein n=1 Tax=Andalucia godoyi TaxID=505711 RepID=A0A8K0F4L0_ANDGO|nr:mitochondrial CIV assembly protein Cmc2 [Andalucia godoyi]|eukprot:ANDGO_05987.mRNA.1 mitochondrial CIV assembly protein Cmc2
MHPFLTETAHSMCSKEMEALKSCHSSHPLKKFIGCCNSVRDQLDQCLNAEFQVIRAKNARKADAEKAKWEVKRQQLAEKKATEATSQSSSSTAAA